MTTAVPGTTEQLFTDTRTPRTPNDKKYKNIKI